MRSLSAPYQLELRFHFSVPDQVQPGPHVTPGLPLYNTVTLRSRPAGITAFFLRSKPGTARTSCHAKAFRCNAVTLRSRSAGITASFLRSRPWGVNRTLILSVLLSRVSNVSFPFLEKFTTFNPLLFSSCYLSFTCAGVE
jgi:hypothetical protein